MTPVKFKIVGSVDTETPCITRDYKLASGYFGIYSCDSWRTAGFAHIFVDINVDISIAPHSSPVALLTSNYAIEQRERAPATEFIEFLQGPQPPEELL